MVPDEPLLPDPPPQPEPQPKPGKDQPKVTA